MNLLLYKEAELEEDRLFLTDHRAAHLLNVLAVKVGSRVKVGQVNAKVGSATVVELGESSLTLQVEHLSIDPPSANNSLILAMPRPQMLKRVLELVPQFGVSHLQLVGGSRVEKSFFGSPLLKIENYTPYLLKGMEQAVVTQLPTVEVKPSFWQFSKDSLSEQRADELKVVCEVKGEDSLIVLESEIKKSSGVRVAIGPEGGWSEKELDIFIESGFRLVNLGKRVLRVDMAVCSILSQIELLKNG